jgi:methionyl-tRNA formyltransferase
VWTGTLEAQPQPAESATLTRPLRREDGRLDPTRTAVELERQVRAYQPWPGSFLEIDGERVIVWRAAALDPGSGLDEGTNLTPGTLAPIDDVLGLVTSDGLLRLDEVQPAGKRRMSTADFRRGRRR